MAALPWRTNRRRLCSGRPVRCPVWGADHPCDEVRLKPEAGARYLAALRQRRRAPAVNREGATGAMQQKLISGDNHIDLTYCPTDLWSSQAPAKWQKLAPRVEERNDGQHWFVDDTDRGMWNGVGPGFLPYTKGAFDHIDEMKELGFEWNCYPGAQPRPTTPELRLADLDRDGLEKEIIYGCLMVNDLIDSADLRVWVNARYNDWAADFAKRSDPSRVCPLASIPNTHPKAAAAEVRRCAKLGLKGGDLAFKRMTPPLYHPDWFVLWEASAECKFPISFHSADASHNTNQSGWRSEEH